jgi:hypothetical protein
MVKSLSVEMENMKFEGKKGYKNFPNNDNRGNFWRPNNHAPQIMPREQRDRDINDQKIQAPLQNNPFMDEKREEEDLDPKIHCIGETSPFPHLTQSTYEESLMNSQINELSKRDKASYSQNKCNLWSKKKEGNYVIPDQPAIAEKPVKYEANNNKEKKSQNTPLIAKDPIPEVREIMKPPSSFKFEHEIHKITILVPLSELVKHE